MSKGSSVDSEDEELCIDFEDDQRHPCCDGLTALTTTMLSLRAMVDAVTDCHPLVDSPSSLSSMSFVVSPSTTSSPRCSPALGRCRQDIDGPRTASPTSPVVDKTMTQRSACHDVTAAGRRLPDVVQLPSAMVRDERRRRYSFLIDEILRPDFGRRRSRPPNTLLDSQRKQFPAEVVGGVNKATSIWQPFVASPSRTVTDDARRRDVAKPSQPPRTSTTKTSGDRMRKSAKRKSRDVHEASTQQRVSVSTEQSSPRSSSSASSGSSSSSSSCDVSVVRTVSSANVSAGQPSKFGQPALPAWVYCTRYSDRPSSGKITCHINQL